MIKTQILKFAVKNWKVIAIVLLAAVMVLKTRYDYHLMESAYATRIESTEAQIQGLKEIHKKELEEKQLLMESFLNSMAAIEEEYEKTRAELEEQRKNKTAEYSRKFSEDKEGLITDIEKTFGFEYVP
tara:strand:+ start:808 stop:1191 length:384 start_codon:yes stop_codon:yes gene_type:complete